MLTDEQKANLCTKKNIEYFCFKYFAQWQQKEYDLNISFIRFRRPPEPDILANVNSKEKWFEIATLYGGHYDAARLLGRIKEKDYRDKIRKESLIPLDRVYVELNHLIANKQKRKYCVSQPKLLIRNAFPLFSKDDFLYVENKFEPGNFDSIWLVCDLIGETGILRLSKDT